MEQRARVEFASETPSEDREAFTVVLGLLGTVHESHVPNEIFVVPRPESSKDLAEQLNLWQEAGALSWSYAT
jgi:hypothetical protein